MGFFSFQGYQCLAQAEVIRGHPTDDLALINQLFTTEHYTSHSKMLHQNTCVFLVVFCLAPSPPFIKPNLSHCSLGLTMLCLKQRYDRQTKAGKLAEGQREESVLLLANR